VKKTFGFVVFLWLLVLGSTIVFAHSGGTDSKGGHYDHINGGYHYHHGYPAHQHPNGECPYRTESNKTTEPKNTGGFFETLFLSAIVGYLGGTILFAVLFFPLKIFLNDDWLWRMMWICPIVVGIIFFIYQYL
jgi:hypothetical protein